MYAIFCPAANDAVWKRGSGGDFLPMQNHGFNRFAPIWTSVAGGAQTLARLGSLKRPAAILPGVQAKRSRRTVDTTLPQATDGGNF